MLQVQQKEMAAALQIECSRYFEAQLFGQYMSEIFKAILGMLNDK